MVTTVGHRRWGAPTNCPYAVPRRATSPVPRRATSPVQRRATSPAPQLWRATSPAPQLWRERCAAALTRLWQRAEQNRRVPFFDSST